MINPHSITKENILYLNRHGYFERVLFANSIVEFDVAFDHWWQLQPAKLFKRPFSIEFMGAVLASTSRPTLGILLSGFHGW